VIDTSLHGFTVRAHESVFLIVIVGILGIVRVSSAIATLTHVMDSVLPAGFTKNDWTNSDRSIAMMNILRSFALSMGDLGYRWSIFLYGTIEKCNIFLEFCNLILIFVIEDDPLLRYEDDIEIESIECSEGEIIESPSKEIAIDAPTCMLG
jgi:hypothetical protein